MIKATPTFKTPEEIGHLFAVYIKHNEAGNPLQAVADELGMKNGVEVSRAVRAAIKAKKVPKETLRWFNVDRKKFPLGRHAMRATEAARAKPSVIVDMHADEQGRPMGAPPEGRRIVRIWADLRELGVWERAYLACETLRELGALTVDQQVAIIAGVTEVARAPLASNAAPIASSNATPATSASTAS